MSFWSQKMFNYDSQEINATCGFAILVAGTDVILVPFDPNIEQQVTTLFQDELSTTIESLRKLYFKAHSNKYGSSSPYWVSSHQTR